PGLEFQGEKQDFEEMVGNLLDNACKWARSRVRAEAQPGKGAARFTVIVDDDGPGLTEAERAKAVTRGHSTRASRAQGLGSRSLPTSHIFIRAASSSNLRPTAACAPG
ncbi:MAG: hypothetical protein H7X74_01725, partial [Methyloceanibacter sp.]|nr:hypothetical protein [Methyloceanibacter sp.]